MKGLTDFLRRNKTTLFLFLSIFLIAFLLRVVNLTELPIFADEAIYVRWAQVMRAEPTLRFLPLSDGKQPLFMWFVIPFFKVFVDPLFAGRFVSVLTGLGTTLGLYFVGYLLFDSKKVGLLSSFIYAISPFSVFFDRMALVDSMLTMFGVFSFLGAILIAKTKRLDVAMITGFLLGCAFLTKSPSLFFALLFPASLLVVEWPKKKSDKLTLLVKIVSLWGVALIIGYGMYNILRLGPNFHLLAQRNKDYVYPLTHILESPLDPFRPFIHRVYQYFLIMGPSVLIFLSALGAGINFKEKRREVLLILAWGLLPILVNSEFAKNMTARYVYFAIPYFFILGASVFLAKSEMMKKLVLAGFIVFVTHSLYINYHFLTDIEAAPLPRSERSGYLEEWTAGVGIKEIANQVKMIRDENGEKEIIVGTEGYFGTLPDGLLIYLEGEPRIRAIGVGLALNVIPEPLLESKKAGNLTYLVVNNERLHLNYDDFGMKLLAVYPKSTRPDGSRQALYLLELTDEALSPKSEIR